jgi:hypothetical protein
VGGVFALAACQPASAPARPTFAAPPPSEERLLEEIARPTFDYFWELANRRTGLVPDRAPTPSFSSIAAVGFGLTAYAIGVERGYVTREQARERTLATLRFFADAGRAGAARGTGEHGFFYHFLDMETGRRFEQVELSTIDTTLLLAGVLFCQSYFDREEPSEREIRALAEELYRAADWKWAQKRAPLVAMGWRPETGFIDWDWRGYNEAMILYVLAMGSPTHSVDSAAWDGYTSTYRWVELYGREYLEFAPLFGHQYSHVWIDFRGLQDRYMRGKGSDYFENSKRATEIHQAYAIQNPGVWRDYGETIWGLSACDGPIDGDFQIDGRTRHFFTYTARGVSRHEVRDDGTIAPSAALSSLPFSPEIALSAAAEMRRRYGDHLFSRYGFLDSFNPTFRLDVPVHHGRVVAGVGWFDGDYLGIDEGPILAMIENYRSELVWKWMRRNPHIRRGLIRAGFSGGWLRSEPAAAARLVPLKLFAARSPFAISLLP